MDCYKFVEYNFDKALLDESIDATYVIHLENNGRINNILEQLYKYRPSKKVYILYNKGYKKCNKILSKNIPDKDLVDCNFKIFKHSKVLNHNNILILEDDFIFSDKIKNKEILNDLNLFLNEHNNTKFIYYLGASPVFSIPYKINHYIPLFIATTHSCIYSKNTREYLLNNENKIVNSWNFWDIYLNEDRNISKYHYKYPLCYQTFPVTENQKHWKVSNNNLINKLQMNFFKICLKIINLNNKPEPGFTIIYTFSFILFYIFIISVIYLIYKYIKVRTNKIM